MRLAWVGPGQMPGLVLELVTSRKYFSNDEEWASNAGPFFYMVKRKLLGLIFDKTYRFLLWLSLSPSWLGLG